jgi:hypothetical protein
LAAETKRTQPLHNTGAPEKGSRMEGKNGAENLSVTAMGGIFDLTGLWAALNNSFAAASFVR